MRDSMLRTIARACRRATLPLGWYYAVTIALPLANGAGQAGAVFVEHALVVLAVPPVLIVLTSAFYEMACCAMHATVTTRASRAHRRCARSW
jgi:hypothetical protein